MPTGTFKCGTVKMISVTVQSELRPLALRHPSCSEAFTMRMRGDEREIPEPCLRKKCQWPLTPPIGQGRHLKV
jgi:hypothetical protein